MDNSFFTLFFVSNVLLSVILCLIFIIKKGFKKQITVHAHYYLSLLSLLVLIAPFIPLHIFEMNSLLHDWGVRHADLTSIHSAANMADTMSQNGNWQQDFSTTLKQSSYRMLDTVFFCVWITGMIFFLLATLTSNLKIYRIKRSLQVVDNRELTTLLADCKKEINVRKKVILACSSLVKSPITFGLFKPYIVLPMDGPLLTDDEMKCVLLHELVHCKRKDLLLNYFMGLVRIVYWFNPLIWYFLKEMRTEMEITCDYSVLKRLDEKSQFTYGEAILKYASHSTRPLIAASEMSSSYKQVKKRIVTIVNFQVASTRQQLKSIFVFTVVLVIILGSIPSISVLAVNKDTYSLTNQKVTIKDYSSFFDNLSGSAVIYDTDKEQYTIFNEEESTTRFAPNSTYKIFSALFALENGIITKDDSTLSWDGTLNKYDKWNQDQDIFTAMENSTTWYFQHLDKQLGKEKVQNYFKQMNYGNEEFSRDITSYWMDGSLKISPVEQIEMLKKFYHNEFSVDPSNINTVKNSILLEESNGNRLSGKTGTGEINGENVDGWFIGYVETADNTFFFVVHIEGEKDAGGSHAANIALAILEKEGIYTSIDPR